MLTKTPPPKVKGKVRLKTGEKDQGPSFALIGMLLAAFSGLMVGVILTLVFFIIFF